jgi:flagellar P-ring protein precursor FlgI
MSAKSEEARMSAKREEARMSAKREGGRMRGLRAFAGCILLATLALPAHAGLSRVAELTRHAGDVPRRIVGYGLVVGLDGTGDRSYGHGSMSVRSVANLLRRFQIEVPAEQLRLRNCAAVLVTAEVSPWLRAGGRFDVQVSALGDATSLRSGTLWITPLVTDPGQPPVATAQGVLYVAAEEMRGSYDSARSNSGRVNDGGVLETEMAVPANQSMLILRDPDLLTAKQIAAAIDTAFGAGTATVQDAGAINLKVPQGAAPALFLAAADTLDVHAPDLARVVIDARDGTVVAGGGLRIGAAVVSHSGITLQIGGAAQSAGSGIVRVASDASVQDVATGLHAAGAHGNDICAVFEALRAAGALHATVVVR